MEKTKQITDLSFEELGLLHYIPSKSRLRVYIGWMKQCHTIKQLMDRVIYIMLLTETHVTKDTADKKDFYDSCLPFIKHICVSIPVTTWRDHVYRVWTWINESKECKSIVAHKNDGTATLDIPAGPDGTANILFKASSLTVFDFIKRNAELERLPYMVVAPKTLAEIKHRKVGARTVQITGNVEQVKQFSAPIVKLVEERKVSVWNRPTGVTFGQSLVKSPRPNYIKAKQAKVKNGAKMTMSVEHIELRG